MPESIEWRSRPPRRRKVLLVIAIVVFLLLSSRTALSYYVELLWFGSLGFADVFRKTLRLQYGVFAVFSVVTFVILYGWFLALRRAYQPDLPDGGVIYIGGQPLKLPVERILRLIVLVVSAIIALATGAGMMAEWPTFALYWYARKPRLALVLRFSIRFSGVRCTFTCSRCRHGNCWQGGCSPLPSSRAASPSSLY